MIQVKELTVALGGAPVLEGLNAVFPAGRVTCVVGPNGCGKTTLLRTMAGLLPVRSGQVLLNGADLLAMPRRDRARRVACLPQTRPVPQIRAGLLVEHGRFPHEGFSKRLDPRGRKAIEKAMADTGTDALADKLLPELSGGERQRVYVAAALAQETDVLLLDEPTTFLDLRCQLELLELCRTLARSGKTVVMVLHDLQQAFTFGDTVCLLDRGKALACSPVAELLGSPLLRQVFGCDVTADPGGSVYTCRLSR